MIIIGIDPGTRITGYGIIKVEGINRFQLLDYGCIRPPTNYDINDRYLAIHRGVEELLDKFSPHTLAIETQYVDSKKSVGSAIKIGMARGVVIVAARKRSVAVAEYSPSTAKRAVTGRGGASKEQVQAMTKQLLGLREVPKPEDAADALALAICHAQKSQRLMLVNK